MTHPGVGCPGATQIPLPGLQFHLECPRLACACASAFSGAELLLHLLPQLLPDLQLLLCLRGHALQLECA